jgi:transposase
MMDCIRLMTAAVTAGPNEWFEDGEMIPVLTRHKVQVLLEAGFAVSDVAERSGVSAASVKRIAAEAEVASTDDVAAHRERRIGRPSKAALFADRVKEWLVAEPDLPTQEVFRRAKEAGYSGQKSALYSLAASVRPKRAVPVVRFEGLPGEFSQHDFGHVDVRFVDGRRKRVHFFASRLKYSRFVQVTLVANERTETIVRCLARDFVAFGGLPLLSVFDRPRTIVQKSGPGREVEQWNSTFAQAVLELGVGVEMCAPRSGNQKGSVERLVGWVKGAFFKPRKFLDEADLRAQLASWVSDVNTKTPSRATGKIPETLRREELPRLRRIKVFPESLALRLPAFIGPTAEVTFEGVRYSMPAEAMHIPATLYLYEDRLQIVAGRHEATHRRRTKDEPAEPLPEHRAAKLAALHGGRAKLYEKRQQILELGASAAELLTEITHREGPRANASVEALYTLLEQHTSSALRYAIERAVLSGELSVRGVRAYLAGDPAQASPSGAPTKTSASKTVAAGSKQHAPRKGAR